MNAQPAVSIIVPCYNAEDVLPRAVASVRAQTFADWELIIVNDCSTDETAAVAARLAAEDPRIRLVDLLENSGSSAARNAGIDVAAGEYVAFLDSDDEMLPRFLADLLDLMADDTDIVGCGHLLVGPDGALTPRKSKLLGRMDTAQAVKAGMMGALTPFPWDKLFRRRIFDGLHYPVGAHRFEDLTMNIALYARSRAVKFTGTPLHRYYVSSGSLTWGRVPSQSDIEIVQKHLEAHLGPEYRTGSFASPYAALQLLMRLSVAQSAVLSNDRSAGTAVLRSCRQDLQVRMLLRTARSSPVLAAGGVLLKAAPSLYSALYRRYASNRYGVR